MPTVRALASGLFLLLLGCGSSSSSDSDSSPLDDLASRLPAASRLVTGLGSSSTDAIGSPSAALDLVSATLDYVDGLRTSWCYGKASTNAGSLQIGVSQPHDLSLTGGTYSGLSILRLVPAGTSACSGEQLPAFWIRLDVVGFAADGTPLPTPWSNATRLSRVLLFGRVAASADELAADAFTQSQLAFALLTGQPGAAMEDADDWAQLPSVPDGLEALDAGHLTAVFFPQQIASAGLGFGSNAQLPEVLTLVVDLSDANRRAQLALLKWSAADGLPLAIDLRVEDGLGVTGAVVFDQSGTPTLRRAFFVELRTAARPAGFALDGADPTALLEAWDVAGETTHEQSNQGSYTLPVDFQGWPGASTAWTQPFGQGLSSAFATAMGGVAPVSGWFGN